MHEYLGELISQDEAARRGEDAQLGERAAKRANRFVRATRDFAAPSSGELALCASDAGAAAAVSGPVPAPAPAPAPVPTLPASLAAGVACRAALAAPANAKVSIGVLRSIARRKFCCMFMFERMRAALGAVNVDDECERRSTPAHELANW